jgi:hypothetical protein
MAVMLLLLKRAVCQAASSLQQPGHCELAGRWMKLLQ